MSTYEHQPCDKAPCYPCGNFECVHGSLRRSCEVCNAEEERDMWKARYEGANEHYRRISREVERLKESEDQAHTERIAAERLVAERADEEPVSVYGVRPILFTDTGERAKIATIGGEPVALEPSEAVVDAWCRERGLLLITKETARSIGVAAIAAPENPESTEEGTK